MQLAHSEVANMTLSNNRQNVQRLSINESLLFGSRKKQAELKRIETTFSRRMDPLLTFKANAHLFQK
jgi:hypothetical protein